jgi:hypothetical protein
MLIMVAYFCVKRKGHWIRMSSQLTINRVPHVFYFAFWSWLVCTRIFPCPQLHSTKINSIQVYVCVDWHIHITICILVSYFKLFSNKNKNFFRFCMLFVDFLVQFCVLCLMKAWASVFEFSPFVYTMGKACYWYKY